MSFGYYQPQMGVPMGSRATSSCMNMQQSKVLGEKNKRIEQSFDPITGEYKTIAQRGLGTQNLGEGMVPTTESEIKSRGSVNSTRNESHHDIITHQCKDNGEIRPGSPSRVTKGNLTSAMIPEGEVDQGYVERPLIRTAGGEFGEFIVPQDKLGPGLVPAVGKEPRYINCTNSGFGRSNLQITEYGIMVNDGSATISKEDPPRLGVGEGYVRKYGRT